MKSVPKFMQGSFRAVLKAIMEEVSAASLARLDCCCISRHVEVSFRRNGWKNAWSCLPVAIGFLC